MPDFKEEARIIRELTCAGSGPDPFSSAVRATRMPMLITDPRQPDNPIVFANAAFARLTGYSREFIIGRNCRFLQGPDTDPAEVARLRTAIEARETIELELLNYRKNGSTFWNRLLISPVFADDGQLTYFFASQFDVTLEKERLVKLQRDRDALEREVADRSADLLASEQRLRFALSAAQLGTWSIDLDTGRLIASDICKAICGRKPDETLTLDELRNTIHPDDRHIQEDAIAEAIANASALDAEYRLILPSGEERWVQIRGLATYRADGSPLTLTGTTHDITERRQAEAHRALLASELSHRVKNTLMSLQAVIAQTMRRAVSLDEAAEAVNSRIAAMSAANDLLVSQQFEGASMAALVQRTLAPFGGQDAGRFSITGPSVKLPPNLVPALGLALHELATNASKYGALSSDEGHVELHWEMAKDASPAALSLKWHERDGPVVTPPTRSGFGTQLINRVLPSEAGATVDTAFDPAGVRFSATLPLQGKA